jgi:hypothetical protein
MNVRWTSSATQIIRGPGLALALAVGSAGCKQEAASSKLAAGSAAPAAGPSASKGTVAPPAQGEGTPTPAPATVAPGAATPAAAPDLAGDAAAVGAPPPSTMQVVPIGADVARPAGLDKRARVIASAAFTDASGANLVWLTSQGDASPSAGEPKVLLQVHHVVRPAGAGDAAGDRVLRHVKELVECLALGADFAADSLRVTDLDHDEVAEVSFAYATWCNQPEGSTRKRKLLVLEAGEKYILRAEVNEAFGGGYGGDGEGYGGEPAGEGKVVPEPAQAGWPKGFYAFARERWTAQFE